MWFKSASIVALPNFSIALVAAAKLPSRLSRRVGEVVEARWRRSLIWTSLRSRCQHGWQVSRSVGHTCHSQTEGKPRFTCSSSLPPLSAKSARPRHRSLPLAQLCSQPRFTPPRPPTQALSSLPVSLTNQIDPLAELDEVSVALIVLELADRVAEELDVFLAESDWGGSLGLDVPLGS